MLKCNLNTSLSILLSLDSSNEETSSRKGQIELFIELWDKKNTKKYLSRRSILWSNTQPLPTEMLYNEAEEMVEVVGSTTVARIPLAKKKIEAITTTNLAMNNAGRVQTYENFAVNPLPVNDNSALLAAVNAVIENPTKSKRWKRFSDALENLLETSSNGYTRAFLSNMEQSGLVETVGVLVNDDDADADFVRSVLTLLLRSRILMFKKHDRVLRLCLSSNFADVVQEQLSSSNEAVSEYVLAGYLSIASKQPTRDRIEEMLRSVLIRGYSHKQLVKELAKQLLPSESICLIEVLLDIYKSYDHKPAVRSPKKKRDSTSNVDMLSKCLELIAGLMDSHGCRFIWEDDLRAKLAEIRSFVVDLAAAVDVFAAFDSRFDENAASDEVNSVKRVSLVEHKLVW